MGKDYFIADTHFGDSRIIGYENRPFESVQEMDKILIEKWNEIVTVENTVYVLGDFSSYNDIKRDRELINCLNGDKVLVIGNHDTHRTTKEWRELGFLECSPWPIIYHGFFLLSHEPMYINRNMPYANIYGHVHGNASYKDASPQSVCISVERIGYQPISMDVIMSKIEGSKR